MNAPEVRQAIQTALAGFAAKPLADAATALFESLGYKSQKRIVLKPNTAETFLATFAQGRNLNPDHARLADWQSVDLLFQLTDEEIRAAAGGNQQFLFDSKGKYNGATMESYLFFAITLQKPQYTRTELSGITRAINRLFDMPVMLLLRHGDTLTLAVINRRLHKREESKDVLEKVTLIKDIRFACPHRAHVEILADLSFDALYDQHQPANFVALHAAWQKSLDTSELNKRFYQEVANWYFWALDNVQFPKDAPKDADGRDAISLIRLLTRLIFCWFVKEKDLIPDDLFNEKRVRALLISMKDDENTYYTAVLQNLFFATLNTEMDEPGKPTRRFIDVGKDDEDSEDHMVHQVWRYADRIRECERATLERLLRNIPFLNGGLFECLDERMEKSTSNYSKEIRVDGFSVKPAKQPKFPNFLFFGPDRTVDLSKAYRELRYTQTKVRPLIPLLERYKFTVAENTPIEEEVALDPELLGHVFENLLAAYNPETDTTARKTTGSFYTPRVVVDFMVDEALLAYFESRLHRAIPKPSSPFEPRLRQLLRYTDEPHQFLASEVRVLMDAIDQLKILDPACGSGAFPMGALHKLVFILGKLDPGNVAWKERQLAKARALDLGREAAIQAVEDAFARDQGDYGRKLYLIENCLYGVDIQPIATQISKLRCFISLIVEQQPDDRLLNRGILPLPNLETKFIAANTLFGLHRRGQMELVAQDIETKKAELRGVRHEHFLARKYSEKKALRKRDKKLREELAELLKLSQLFSGPEADMVASWDPYHADRSAPFFDGEWMFNLDPQRRMSPSTMRGNLSFVNEVPGQMEIIGSRPELAGFDIVIGNPPYVRQEELKKMKAFEGILGLERPLKDALKEDYFCYTGVADLFVYFFEKSFDLLAVGGVLSFITSNKYFRAGYGERLRHFLAANGELRLLIDFGDAPVFSAIAYPSIVVARKTRETRDKGLLSSVPKDLKKWSELVSPEFNVRTLSWEPGPSIEEFPDIVQNHGFMLPQREFKPDGWRLESPAKLRLLEKLRRVGPPLGEYVKDRFYYGIKTGLNEAFVVDREVRNRLIAEHKSSAEVLKPFLRGRDVKRWKVGFADQYLIKIESSENKQHPWSCKAHLEAEKIFAKGFPAIHAWFDFRRKELESRYDQGRFFWELRSCDYYAEFEHTKILYPDIYEHQSFTWDDQGFYAANTCYFIPTKEKWLTGLLNSLTVEWFYGLVSNRVRGGYLRAFSDYMHQIPIPKPSRESLETIEATVTKIQREKQTDPNAFVGELEAKIDGLVAHLYDLSDDEYRLILDDLALPDPVRVGALNAYRDTKRNLAK